MWLWAAPAAIVAVGAFIVIVLGSRLASELALLRTELQATRQLQPALVALRYDVRAVQARAAHLRR